MTASTAAAASASSGMWERGGERGVWREARVRPGQGCPYRSTGATGRPRDGRRMAMRAMDAGAASTATVNRGRKGMAWGWASSASWAGTVH